jgi:hypothetical protein
MSDNTLKSSAIVSVWLDAGRGTIKGVRDWLAEVERLHLPDDTVLDECYLSVSYTSDLLDVTENESELGVWGTDIIVGMPRAS